MRFTYCKETNFPPYRTAEHFLASFILEICKVENTSTLSPSSNDDRTPNSETKLMTEIDVLDDFIRQISHGITLVLLANFHFLTGIGWLQSSKTMHTHTNPLIVKLVTKIDACTDVLCNFFV